MDISMCCNPNCKISEKCYRHEDSGSKADPERQSFIYIISVVKKPEDCGVFWDKDKL